MKQKCGRWLFSLLKNERLCEGITESIRAVIGNPNLGVGRQVQDDFFTSEENVQRRKLVMEIEETQE